MLKRMAISAVVAVMLVAPASAQHGGGPATAPGSAALRAANDPYRPYEFLIGDWLTQEGSSTLRQSIRWGPGRSYIMYSTYMKQPGTAERLHFEGPMIWNGKTKMLDFLFAVEPGSWIQERGTLRVESDGTIVRDVDLIQANGTTSQFRQTIRRVDANTAITSLMIRNGDRWEPNFPGSDRIEMKRQPS